MSTCVVITPIIIASWPMISAAVTGAVGSLGFSVIQMGTGTQKSQHMAKTKAEIEVDNTEILGESGGGAGETIVVERQGIRAIFSRDRQGALKVCMEAEGVSKQELTRIGQELVDSVTQQYAYNRIVTELKARNMHIVDETVSADRTVTIRVRNL